MRFFIISFFLVTTSLFSFQVGDIVELDGKTLRRDGITTVPGTYEITEIVNGQPRINGMLVSPGNQVFLTIVEEAEEDPDPVDPVAGSFSESASDVRYFIGRGVDPIGGAIAAGIKVDASYDGTIVKTAIDEDRDPSTPDEVVVTGVDHTLILYVSLAGYLAQDQRIAFVGDTTWYELQSVTLRLPQENRGGVSNSFYITVTDQWEEVGPLPYSISPDTPPKEIKGQLDCEVMFSYLNSFGNTQNITVRVPVNITAEWSDS